jgi:hypothetical protein
MELAHGGLSTAGSPVTAEEKGRKRQRECDRQNSSGGSRTPPLICRRVSDVPSFQEEDDPRPIKRFCGPAGVPLVPQVVEIQKEVEVPLSSPLSVLPEDVLAHCLSFLNSTQDRFALQCTSKQFRNISNTDKSLLGVQVGGDCTTGLNGIILDDDTPETAAAKLMPFASAGNLEAVYM